MTKEQTKKLGALIQQARLRRGLTLRGLAEQTSLSAMWISGVEAGRFAQPAADRLARLSEALNIAPARLDRVTAGTMSASLPAARTYFRSKYHLSPEQTAQVEAYIERLQRGAP